MHGALSCNALASHAAHRPAPLARPGAPSAVHCRLDCKRRRQLRNERSRVSEMTGHDLPKQPVTVGRNTQPTKSWRTGTPRRKLLPQYLPSGSTASEMAPSAPTPSTAMLTIAIVLGCGFA